VTITVLLRTIERVTKTKCLTCECEIILSVFYNPKVSAGYLYGQSRYSSTTFYGTLKRLTETGVVICQTDPNDRRSNVYDLNGQYRDEIEIVIRSTPILP
jgi:DNA-binding MarR family transcriptional regulator